jgi:type I restriction enzyme S subunit
MLNKYFMLLLNCGNTRGQIRRFEQGVTRPRINTSNLKRVEIFAPKTINEQVMAIKSFDTAQAMLNDLYKTLEKYKKQKSGLMHDLLTGKVEVTVTSGDTANV